MRYNELTYHKANPFYQQGFMPDIAWYNRHPKEFPSQIPSGENYFAESGRKHFLNKFNRSQIQQNAILVSPERYPCQNRIALDKNFKRNLDTIDIEGAASGTRVNQSIKNKIKAQQELASRLPTQSLDLKSQRELQLSQKRKEIALKQYESIKQKKTNTSSRIKLNDQAESPQKRATQPNPEYGIPEGYGKRFAHKQKCYGGSYNSTYNSNQMLRQNNSLILEDQVQNRSKPNYQTNNNLNMLINSTIDTESPHLYPRREIRKYNPNNLSFALAAQSIVENK